MSSQHINSTKYHIDIDLFFLLLVLKFDFFCFVAKLPSFAKILLVLSQIHFFRRLNFVFQIDFLFFGLLIINTERGMGL